MKFDNPVHRQRLHYVQMALKWLIYVLLIYNFTGYYAEDRASIGYSMPDNPDWLDWAGSYATTLDVFAWLVLLGLFEFETYFMSERASSPGVGLTKGARAICYLVLAHTCYAYWGNYQNLVGAMFLPTVHDLCQLVASDVSYLWNLQYVAVSTANCEVLGQGPDWFRLYNQSVVTDTAGLKLELQLAVADLLEISFWLSIMALLEFVVILQERGVTRGLLLKSCQYLKLVLYLGLGVLCVFWIRTDHWLYSWDTFVWIAGFAAIEFNLSEWREEIREEQMPSAASA